MLEDLRSELEKRCVEDGLLQTADPALSLFRSWTYRDPIVKPEGRWLDEPALCVVVCGLKRATIGTRRVVFAPGTATLACLELPVTDAVIEPSETDPFLGLRLTLDPAVLAELLLDLPPIVSAGVPELGLTAAPLAPELLDPLVRLILHLDDPHELAALGAATRREISYRLLRGPHGSLLRQIATQDSRLSQIKHAVELIRANFAKPLRMSALADSASMSLSSFYEHFKQVTAMSPLQFQKQLRLNEARKLILDGTADATTASFAVGYESPSQFNREYKRLFGAPPIRDVARLREVSTTSVPG
ncbi:AraC family transcriptional regulator N-terminal domain-containing protein [Streptomyces sp. NPDC090499]|uniref:AraC family transcriptional regulator n=1 Tax=unclassified Streptomyces TaxID=2593676 RepID=UPI00381F8E98